LGFVISGEYLVAGIFLVLVSSIFAWSTFNLGIKSGTIASMVFSRTSFAPAQMEQQQ